MNVEIRVTVCVKYDWNRAIIPTEIRPFEAKYAENARAKIWKRWQRRLT